MASRIAELSYFLPPLPGGGFTLGLILFAITYILITVLETIFLHFLKKISERTKTELDDFIFDSFKSLSGYFALLVSSAAAVLSLYPEMQVFGLPIQEVFAILLILFFTALANRLASAVLKWYGHEIIPKSQEKAGSDVFPLIRKIAAVLIYAAGLMIILDRLGVEIGPLIAGLGIAGLAVALALQDTLGNFFAGIYIFADKPIRMGDFIRAEGAAEYEGHVAEIGWRSTKIKTPSGMHVIIPNAKLAQSTIINYTRPTSEVALVLDYQASYDSDIEKVEKVLSDCVNELKKEESSISAGFEPIIRFEAIKDSSLQFKVILKILSYTERFNISTKLNKAVLKAFRKNKIEVPYPVRTIYMRK